VRRALGGVALLLALASVWQYARDRRDRELALRILRSASPAAATSAPGEIANAPAADLASAAAVTQALSNATAPGAAGGSGPLLREARDRMVSAIRTRPGSADHRYLLGLVELQSARGSGGRLETARWARTLRLAAEAAPGTDAPWLALCEGSLVFWKALPPSSRQEAPEVFRRCFRRPSFVATRFRPVAAAIGASDALALLPDESRSLGAAAHALIEGGDVEGSSLLLSRSERADRRERADDLLELEGLRRRGDVAALRAGCRVWFDRHPFGFFDDAAGRSQVARLLEVWPKDPAGPWDEDPRGELVRFFLDGRDRSVGPRTLFGALQSLTGVPGVVQARVLLIARDRAGAEKLAASAGEPAPIEWAPYFVELASRELREGRLEGARDAAAKLSPAAREECEALLVRRDIARRLAKADELGAIEKMLGPLCLPPPGDWSSRGAVSLCLDPESAAGDSVRVRVGSGAATLLSYGWDGGRLLTASLPSRSVDFRVPLAGRAGRHTLWASFSGPVRSLEASSEPAPP
jgi:hypothetical protein